tara:strand:+ start:95978 stop:96970 length:993 start_codon:yes stop_codon:yes gene_type:complete
VVAGAGAVGCFVGGALAAGGHDVTLLARPRIAQEIRAHGLTLTDFSGMAQKVNADTLTLAEHPACLSRADVVLVTVKSHDTADMAATIAAHARLGSRVVSLQNGTGNANTLSAALSGFDLRAGMVPFNVVPLGQGCFHRASSGDIMVAAGPGDLATSLSVAHLRLIETRDIEGVLWGKFLINLNNALNALSGLPLYRQLHSRDWRRLMAEQWVEALKVLRARGIRPVSTTPVGVGIIPHILRLPTPLFSRIAASMLTLDAQARTSMAHDLMAHRPTEIDALQGEVQRMGIAAGLPTPIADMVLRVMAMAELADEGLPHLPVKALRGEIWR